MCPLFNPRLWCKRGSSTEPNISNKAAFFRQNNLRNNNGKIMDRVRAVARKTTDIRRAIMSEAPRKNPNPRSEVATTPKLNLNRKKNFLCARNSHDKNRARVAKHLMEARLEPPRDAYDLPNFCEQKGGGGGTSTVDSMEPVFSHVHLNLLKVENTSAVARSLIFKASSERNWRGDVDNSPNIFTESVRPEKISRNDRATGLSFCKAAITLQKLYVQLAFLTFCHTFNLLPKNLEFKFSSLTNLSDRPGVHRAIHACNVAMIKEQILELGIVIEAKVVALNTARLRLEELDTEFVNVVTQITFELCLAIAYKKMTIHENKVGHLIDGAAHICTPVRRVFCGFFGNGNIGTNASFFNYRLHCGLNHFSLSILDYCISVNTLLGPKANAPHNLSSMGYCMDMLACCICNGSSDRATDLFHCDSTLHDYIDNMRELNDIKKSSAERTAYVTRDSKPSTSEVHTRMTLEPVEPGITATSSTELKKANSHNVCYTTSDSNRTTLALSSSSRDSDPVITPGGNDKLTVGGCLLGMSSGARSSTRDTRTASGNHIINKPGSDTSITGTDSKCNPLSPSKVVASMAGCLSKSQPPIVNKISVLTTPSTSNGLAAPSVSVTRGMPQTTKSTTADGPQGAPRSDTRRSRGVLTPTSILNFFTSSRYPRAAGEAFIAPARLVRNYRAHSETMVSQDNTNSQLCYSNGTSGSDLDKQCGAATVHDCMPAYSKPEGRQTTLEHFFVVYDNSIQQPTGDPIQTSLSFGREVESGPQPCANNTLVDNNHIAGMANKTAQPLANTADIVQNHHEVNPGSGGGGPLACAGGSVCTFGTTDERVNNTHVCELNWLTKVGNRFCIPTLAKEEDFLFSLDAAILRATYAARHAERVAVGHSLGMGRPSSFDRGIHVPFETRSPWLPEALACSDLDSDLGTLRRAMLSAAKTEFRRHREKDSGLVEAVTGAAQACRERELVIVPSDKTKRNVVLSKQEYLRLGDAFLQGDPSYRRVLTSHSKHIEQEANRRIEAVKNSLRIPAASVKKLKVSNSRPAAITFTIKDHKEKKADGSYPVRPIASVHNTPVDGIDWLLQQELSAAVERVPANLVDAAEATALLDELNETSVREGQVRSVFSLDVVNLYPSLDTERFAPMVADFMFEAGTDDMPGVGSTGLGKKEFLELLLFTCRHYEVEFNKKTYLQSFGVPMGARFAPPFAIISMHIVESAALSNLLHPNAIKMYRRYIDDVIVVVDTEAGQVTEVRENIFNTFNRTEVGVQFTIELPGAGGGLPFLDLMVAFDIKGRAVYQWYQKPTHSGFLMHRRSFFNGTQKKHFLINRFVAVFERCNTSRGLNTNTRKMHALLTSNGYCLQEVNRALVIAVQKYNIKRNLTVVNDNSSSPGGIETTLGQNEPVTRADRDAGNTGPLNFRKIMGINPIKIPFVSDAFTAKVKKLINRLNLPLRVVNDKARQVGQLGVNPAPAEKCRGRCQICRILPKNAHCRMGNVVYEASCKHCNGSYIGKTARNLYGRMSQHKSELDRMDQRGPLPAHLLEHGLEAGSLNDFEFKVVTSATGGVETSIKEAICIDCYRPGINRKEERQFFL